MIYDIKHVTTCHYEWPNALSRCATRLLPAQIDGQQILSSQLVIEPNPETIQQRYDFFGAQVTIATITSPHRELILRANARVVMDRRPPPVPGLTPTWELVKADTINVQSLAPDSPVHHLYPSQLVPLVSIITAYAEQSFTPNRPILEAAVELMCRIRDDFKYAPKSTEISTPIAQAFNERRGVCQDFAHIMIAGLRGLGLASAYVSGYLRTLPPPGQAKLEGADAMHAWVSLWCGPEFGWLDLDPTNAMLVGNQHITVARGRDYADVSPIDGVIIGSGEQSMDVAVDVTQIF